MQAVADRLGIVLPETIATMAEYEDLVRQLGPSNLQAELFEQVARLDLPKQMENEFLFTRVIQAGAGECYSIFMTNQNRTFVFGLNQANRFSHTKLLKYGENFVQLTSCANDVILVRSDGRVIILRGLPTNRLDDPRKNALSLFPKDGLLNEGEIIVQAAGRFNHITLLSSHGRVIVLASDDRGKIGFTLLPLTELLIAGETIIQAIAGNDHTILLTSNGRVVVFGENCSGALGPPSVLRGAPTLLSLTGPLNDGEIVVQINAFGDRTMLLSSHGRVFFFGWEVGEGTSGRKNLRPTSLRFAGLLMDGEVVVQIVMGEAHTFFITSYRRVFGLGFNKNRELGFADYRNREVPALLAFNYWQRPDLYGLLPLNFQAAVPRLDYTGAAAAAPQTQEQLEFARPLTLRQPSYLDCPDEGLLLVACVIMLACAYLFGPAGSLQP